MRRRFVHAAMVASLLVGAAAASAETSADQRQAVVNMSTEDWLVETILGDLDYPWDVQASGGRLFITEAAGGVVVIGGNNQARRYALRTTVGIAREGGGGLLGMALSKDFETSGVAYFYHTYRADGQLRNRVIEARFDGEDWRETKALLDGIPGHRLYNGGRVSLGPDGNLYVSTGWVEDRDFPQDPRSLAGKILRMTTSGRVPSDNPFAESYVYSMGHRNPQGLAWSPGGELFAAEHGQSAHDEINRISAGRNFGWPVVDGDERRAGMEPPFVQSGNATWAPSGIAFSGNELLVATLVGRGIYVLDPRSGRLRPIFTSGDRYRDVISVGDDIYAITTNRSPRGDGPSKDHLIKLSPKR